jgi:hypothetical protein
MSNELWPLACWITAEGGAPLDPGSILMIMPAETINRKLFTVDEYHRMSDIGIFPEDKRFELIRGEIYEMPTARPPHRRVNRLNHLS